MPTLDLTFFGSFQVTLDGRPVTKFRSANVRGLLVYLALRSLKGSCPAERDRLATLFWPEEPDGVAKTNLRQGLYHLRNALEDKKADPSFFVSDRRLIMLNPAADIRVDVGRFLQAAEQGDLEAAGILFAGELLPGFVCDSPDFEGWLRHERDKLNRAALQLLGELSEQYLKNKDYAKSKRFALQQLAIEPWREMAHYQLMQALALAGEREAAIAQFEQLEQILETELGISPQQESFDLIRQIENNELGGRLQRSAAVLAVPYQAPTVPDHLVGRDGELAALETLLIGDEELVALVGMGGIGKTTLAAATARKLRDQFPDGILWGNTLLSSADNILEVWAQAYGYDFSGITDLDSLATAVRNILVDKRVLIVLDNVTEQTDLRPLLQPDGPSAMLITTRSRDAAAAAGAHIVPVQALAAEHSISLIGEILDRPELHDHAKDASAAGRIGELLEHLPLAVEITAQLLKARPRMTLQRMVERLQDSQQRRGLKISNKAVRASFELSWEHLPPELRTLFGRIGVFEGRSFTLAALESICDTDPFDTEDDLYSLVSRSLVRLDGEERYKQHPLLADFAAEKLAEAGREPILTRLIDFYLGFAQQNALNYSALQPEWDNLLAIALGAAELGANVVLLDLTDALHDSWFRYGRYNDAQTIYALAETAAHDLGNDERLLQTLIRWSEMGLEQSHYDAVWERLEKALPVAYKRENETAVGQLKYSQALVLFDQGEYQKAKRIASESIEIFEEQKAWKRLAVSKTLLGWIFYESDKTVDRATKLAQDAQKLFQELDNLVDEISTLRLMSYIAFKKEDYLQAKLMAEKSLNAAVRNSSRSEEVASQYLLVGIYRAMKAYDEAIEIANICLGNAQKIGLIRWEGMILQELCGIYLQLGELNQAKRYNEKILEIFVAIKDRLNYGHSLRQLGDIYAQLGQTVNSHKYWNEAYEIANFLNHTYLLNQLEDRLNSN